MEIASTWFVSIWIEKQRAWWWRTVGVLSLISNSKEWLLLFLEKFVYQLILDLKKNLPPTKFQENFPWVCVFWLSQSFLEMNLHFPSIHNSFIHDIPHNLNNKFREFIISTYLFYPVSHKRSNFPLCSKITKSFHRPNSPYNLWITFKSWKRF